MLVAGKSPIVKGLMYEIVQNGGSVTQSIL